MEAISRHRKPTPVGQYGAAYNDGINAAIQEILLAPTLTQPNEPLTLDELRQMDEPVWVACKPIEGGKGYWCLCQHGHIITPAGSIFDVKEIPHWVLYRCPPEEDKHGDYHPVMNR